MNKQVYNKKKWLKPTVKELSINSQTANGNGMGQETVNVMTGKLSNGSYQ